VKTPGARKFAEQGPGESHSLLTPPLPEFTGYGILHEIDRYWILMTGIKTVTSAFKKPGIDPKLNPKLNQKNGSILPL
jgi:hypothetical protein